MDPSEAAVAPSPPPRPRAGGHPLRLALIIAGLTAIALGILYWRVGADRRELLRIQQNCLDYQAPAEQVVYDEQPERAAELLKNSTEYQAVALPSAEGSPIAGMVPAPWRAMREWALRGAPAPQHAVLFLHERQTADGTRGLLCVEADRDVRRLQITFIHPGSSKLDPVALFDVEVRPMPQDGLIILSDGGDPFASKLPPEDDPAARANLRFFAGFFDAKDPSHFTLPYERDGVPGELQMWVQDERTVYYLDRTLAGKRVQR